MAQQMTWILLRGLTRESGHWGDFAAQFAQAVPQAHIKALDLPGNGRFYLERSPGDVLAMVEHCRTELARQQMPPPYGLLAMSLGAMLAVQWSQRYPQEVAAQVLINTSMRPFSAFYQRLRPANYAALLRLLVLGASPQVWESTVLHLTSHKADASVLAAWLAIRRARPVSRANAFRQLLAAARFSAPSKAPVVPTLVLAGEQDRLVDVQCSQALARHWQCALQLHPDAGHDLPLDDGAWVVQQVQQWLSLAGHIS